MTLRIVVTGPECTGKTTLATELAYLYAAPVVKEAARRHAAETRRAGRELTVDDVEPIARLAIAADDAALDARPAMIVLDTDLISTVAYARHYYGASSAWLEGEARARRGELYLLCAPDIAWVADGIRDRPEGREEMFAHFHSVLTEFGARVANIRGMGSARLEAARAAVSASGLTPPSLY